MTKVKVIANYLPQYHTIPENDKWWGKGFTDWVAVKNSKPLFKGHKQPRVPLHHHYYSLNDVNEIRWQAELARKYGIYGFGIYHYWFSSEMQLLQKPAELIRDNKDIDIHYMFIWDNCSWKRTWSKEKFSNDWAPKFDGEQEVEHSASGILAELVYGTEPDWKKHFDYLLTFFKDDRYIKIDNKPVFAVFQPHNNFPVIKKMVVYWDELAKKSGFNGIICMTKDNCKGANLDYRLRYTPLSPEYFWDAVKIKIKNVIYARLNKIRFYDYDSNWQNIIKNAKKANSKTYLSGFVNFDDSPRRLNKARIIKSGSPQKFGKYMEQLMRISLRQHKEYVFVTAWNEWGEGAYLEPDEENKYAYLEELKQAIDKVNRE